jgi:glycosyltransferase involved in cell wall biosynthesis
MIPSDTDIVQVHCASHLDYGYPVVKTVHGYPFYRKGRPLAQRNDFDRHYSFVSDSHRKVCGRPENPYVLNGIDLNEYIYSEDKDDYFLFLGKVDQGAKGLALTLKIAYELKLKLLIAGDFLNPDYYETTLKGLVDNNVKYIGPVGGQYKAELLSRARAVISPAIWPEPFGLVVAEALASGTPVLTSYEGAMPEIMIQGVTGFMCQSVGEMKSRVKDLDKIEPLNCRKHVEELFTTGRMAQDYLKLYERVIEQYHGAQTGKSDRVKNSLSTC